MQSTAYIYMPRHNERRVSLSKASMILANFALWATLIGGVVLAVG